MSFDTRLKYLGIALNLFGFFFLAALGPLMLGLWPSGWTRGVYQGHSHYTLMIIAMYAVLGGFLLLAAVCGQALVHNGFAQSWVSQDVTVALSAMMVLAHYQSEGYALVE